MGLPVGAIAKLGGLMYKREGAYGPGGLTRGGQVVAYGGLQRLVQGADEHKKRRGALR